MLGYAKIYAAAAAGTVIVTVNRRLSRTLHSGYPHYQQQRGAQVWARPAILTLDDWLYQQLSHCGEAWRLLTAAQSACLWRQVIGDDLTASGFSLLQLQSTVRQVTQAHRLCYDYQLDRNYGAYSAEHQAFVRWRTEYQRRCAAQHWCDAAQLTDDIIQAFAAGRLVAPQRLMLLGFDALTPAQQRLQRQLESAGCRVEFTGMEPQQDGCQQVLCCEDETAEIVAAARWARQQLEAQIGTVAVVVPDLARLRSQIERVFRRELQDSPYPQRVPAQTFNVSLGQPLRQQGMIAAALALLAVGREIEIEPLSYLLRSPWLAGGVSEAGARAQFECWLRTLNRREFTLSALRQLCHHHPATPASVTGLITHILEASHGSVSQSLVAWADDFDALLQRAGWPGERALHSEDYQTLSAWREKLLPALRSLAAVHPPTDRPGALALLSALATEQLFQPQSQDDRLQVTGILETAGLYFDALWVMGMTDQALPGSVQHNPFLPVELQRRLQMPHASIEHEFAYARQTMQRLIAAAPQRIISYSCREGDRPLRPSPFIPEQWSTTSFIDDRAVAVTAALESFIDPVGAALLSGADQQPVSGGTALLKEQAACPFRAYAHYRLKTRALEVAQAGLDNRMRGDVLHQIFEQFWQQLESHQRLCALSDAELVAQVTTVVADVLGKVLSAPYHAELRDIEQQRLTQLLLNWLQHCEKPRTPFRVVQREVLQQVQIGPLILTAIPDRVDYLEDCQGYAVIDYKSGTVNAAALAGDRLLEPQLPIYALKSTLTPVVAVAFAEVRAGHCAFRGIAANGEWINGVKSAEKCQGSAGSGGDWSSLLNGWQGQLEALAADYASGQAQVRPANPGVCQFCDLSALCRIADQNRED